MKTNTATRRAAATLMLAVLSLPLTAQAASPEELDARFDAGWRPGKGYCAFGGETPKLSAWCAEVNFGAEGLEVLARAANEKVLARANGEKLPCTEHVAQVRQELAAYKDYKVTELYSCAANPEMKDGRAICHVSLLVTGAAGAQVVVDNGHVLDPQTTSGVGSYGEFASLVDHHWTGTQPTAVALASN